MSSLSLSLFINIWYTGMENFQHVWDSYSEGSSFSEMVISGWGVMEKVKEVEKKSMHFISLSKVIRSVGYYKNDNNREE